MKFVYHQLNKPTDEKVLTFYKPIKAMCIDAQLITYFVKALERLHRVMIDHTPKAGISAPI